MFAPSYKCDNAEYDSFISDLQLQTLIYSESTDIIFIQQYPRLNLNRNSGILEWNSRMNDLLLHTADDETGNKENAGK